MEHRALIDVLDAEGVHVQRLRVDAWPVRIGRAVDNDIVLDDPHVAAHHAEIAAAIDGGLWIRDLGTINGLRDATARRRVDALALDAPRTILVGRSRLRIRVDGDAIAPERPLRRDLRIARPVAAIAIFLAVVGLEILEAWLAAGPERDVLGLATPGLLVGGTVLIWAAFWAFAGRLVSRRTEYVPHLGIGAAAMLVLSAGNTLGAIAAYAFAAPVLDRYGYLPLAAIIAVAAFAHLNWANPERRRAFAVVAMLIGVTVLGVNMLTQYEQSGGFADKPFSSALYPPRLRLATAIAPEAFLARSETLARRATRERRPALSGDPGDDD